jgi:small-conductance mechanosensitive channel
MLPTPVVAAVVAPFVVWRVYSRIKRLTTRQHSKMWRHRATLVFFPLAAIALAIVAVMSNPIAIVGLSTGLVFGVVLGYIAIGKTRFEQVADDFYFIPNAPIGAVVALLFIGRMAWRAYEFYAGGATQDMVASPLTLCIFGVLAGYYISYAFGLLAWRKRTAITTITQ